MQQSITHRQTLVELQLGASLQDFVLSRRPDQSWRSISRDLYDVSGGKVDVTGESLRNWYGDAEHGEPAQAAS